MSGLQINTRLKMATLGDQTWPCRIGMSGYVPQDAGREGDGKTPLGDYRLRFGLYRADRLPKPRSALTFRALQKEDGWCDGLDSPAYNRFIRLPSPESHERLWREDGAYDLIVVISHNDSPPQAGLGSAVFLHVAQPDDRETLGCVTFAPDVWAQLLPQLTPDMPIRIYAE